MKLPGFVREFSVFVMLQRIAVAQAWVVQPLAEDIQNALCAVNRPAIVRKSRRYHLVPKSRRLAEHLDQKVGIIFPMRRFALSCLHPSRSAPSIRPPG